MKKHLTDLCWSFAANPKSQYVTKTVLKVNYPKSRIPNAREIREKPKSNHPCAKKKQRECLEAFHTERTKKS